MDISFLGHCDPKKRRQTADNISGYHHGSLS